MDNIGIIIPPLELKNIIDKTAEYVALKGPYFENIIKDNNDLDKNKFSFLQHDDTFWPYYNSKIKEIKSKINNDNSNTVNEPINNDNTNNETIDNNNKAITHNIFIIENKPSITIEQDEIIKLAAQYLSQNGEDFIVKLMENKKGDPDFDFLYEDNHLYPYFISLATSYINAVNLEKIYYDMIKLDSSNKYNIIQRTEKIAKEEIKNKKKIKNKTKKQNNTTENNMYDGYEWDNFVIVQTITFDDIKLIN